MFLDNKYTICYNSIILRAKSRELSSSIYTEKHHIIPKSLKGTNDPANIVILTAKEHFICHLLLTRMVEGKSRRSMWYASYMMCKGIQRYKPTGRVYEILRQNMIKANKERPGPNLNRVMPQEQKDKISVKQKNIPKGPMLEETKEKLRQKRSQSTKDKISKSRTGVSNGTRTNETKEKMAQWQKNIPKPKIECEFCNKEISIMNHAKWHGDKCKANPDSILYAAPQMNSTMKTCEHCNKEFNTGNYSRWHGDKCKFKQSA